MARHAALTAATLAGALMLAGCSGGSAAPDDGRPSIVAALYPLAYAAEQVAGGSARVSGLTPAGVEPHDLELTAAQVAEIAQADLVLYIKGLQPAVDEAIAQQAADRALDVLDGLDVLVTGEATDPHVWLDPANLAVIGEAVAARLGEVDPVQAAAFSANAAALAAQMATLDLEYTDGLATCASRDIVVSHAAFGYLANAYGLTQVGISGLSPDAEPSPARLREVADLVRSTGTTTIYYETLVDPKIAQTLADETGAATAVLDPLEGLAAGASGNYASIMRANLATLIAGQGCS
ncbi:MAG: metal ABC transporter substrate-binding protein [Candidatus Nanopelagicales bacterium]